MKHDPMVICPQCGGDGQDGTGCPDDWFGVPLCDLCGGTGEVPVTTATEYLAETE